MTQPAGGGPTTTTPPVAAPRRAPPGGALKRFRARWFALIAATLIALYLCWRMIVPSLSVLLWATVLVIIFYPMHQRIVRRTGRPGLSAALSCAAATAVILLPLTLIAVAVVREARRAADGLQPLARRVLAPDSAVSRWVGRYVPGFEDLREGGLEADTTAMAEAFKDAGGVIAGRALGFVGGALAVVVKFFFALIAMYYLFRDADRIRIALHDFLPLEASQSDEIFARTREVIHASVEGVLLIAAIQGALGGLAFWALGLPAPFLWGAVMFMLSLMPMLGAFLVWVPAALFLLAGGHWVKALLLTVWGGLVIGMLDNVLRPRLVGTRARLHELIIFFSVLGGLQVFGVLGLVIGPVVVAVTIALLDVLRQAERPTAAPPAAAVPLPAGAPSPADDPTLLERQDALREVPDQDRPPPGAESYPSVVTAAPAGGGGRRKKKRARR